MSNKPTERTIDCPEALIAAVRRVGIIPFFKNPVTGWSIEEMTAPGFWFMTDQELGPWDWKIDAVRSGLAYGKFLGDRAAFATEEWYRELMNYRRSLPKYRIALGEYPRRKASTKFEEVMRRLSKPALDAIQENGALESKQIRRALSEVTGDTVKKSVSDVVMTFLQMGTWSLIGNFERVYRGPNLTYSGWQLSSNTTPEQFWGAPVEAPKEEPSKPAPFWAKMFMEDEPVAEMKNLGTPEESRRRIIDHVIGMYPEASVAAIGKLV